MGRALYLYDVLREAGVPVIRHPGWEYAGSATLAEQWQMFHHTASSRSSGNHGALGIIVNGRSDLPPPLANAEIGRDGTWVLTASGRANHAGDGRYPDGVTSSNGHALGWEPENDGVGEPWGERLMDSLARGMAAVARYKGWPNTGSWIGRVIGHREYTSRKIDPANVDLHAFRRTVGTLMADPEPIPEPNSEDTMLMIFPPKGRRLGPPIVVTGAGAFYVGTGGVFRQAEGMTVVQLPNNAAGVAEYKRWQGRVNLVDRLLRRKLRVQVVD